MLTQSYIKQEKTYVDDGRKTIPDCLKMYAKTSGDSEAVVFASYSGSREVVTWTDLLVKSTAVAKSLIQLGVKPGEVVAINLRTCPEWLYVVFGTMLAGACAASISFTYKDGSDLVTAMETIANCSMLVMDPGIGGSNWNIVKSLLDSYSVDGTAASKKMKYLRYVIGFEKGEDKVMTEVKPLQDLIDTDHRHITLPELTDDTLSLILQTSGSTGVPKLAGLTQRNIMLVCQSKCGGFWDPDLVMYNDRPFSWTGGFPWGAIAGQKRVTLTGFDEVPEDRLTSVMEIIVREKCDTILVLPPMLHGLVAHKDKLPKGWKLKGALVGGQPLSKGITAAIGSIVDTLIAGYGGTEFMVLCIGATSDPDCFKECWCGNVLPGPSIEIKVVDDNGDIVPVNTRGEMYIRMEGVFQGYYDDPVKTAAVKTPDGWYKTDDISSISENGDIFVYGRKSNLIISGGMNVAPEILERCIKQCPGIATVVIVPIPDEVYYQVLCACLIRAKGSDVTEEQVRAYCEDTHNDKRKLFTVLPKYYFFLDSFPENANGKTNRLALRKLAERMFIDA